MGRGKGIFSRMGGMMGMPGMGGGMPQVDPAALGKLAKSALPGAMPAGLPPGFPGVGGGALKLPGVGLPGLPGLPKKK